MATTNNPTKTQYIQSGRSLATQLCNVLSQADVVNDNLNKLGFTSTGGDPITQEDLDAAMVMYPGYQPGALTVEAWNGGVYAIGKNANDYRGGEDQNLLKIKA